MSDEVFISHAAKDKSIAAEVCKTLEGHGHNCWIAPRDIVPGGDWSEAIIDAINQSCIMVLIYSESASCSIQIKREVERAASKGLTIVPFRIEDIPVAKSLEFYLSTAYWLDAILPPLEEHLEYLNEMVEKLVGKPKDPKPARRPGQCAECGTAMPPESKRCDVCGNVREVSFLAQRKLPGSGRPYRTMKWWPLRLRSRRSKIVTAIACLIIVILGIVLAMTWPATQAKSVDAYLNEAEQYQGNREYERALQACTTAIEKYPENAVAYRVRGIIYFYKSIQRRSVGDLPQAIEDLTKAISLSPGDDIALQFRGQAYSAQNNFEEAIKDVTAAIEINNQPGYYNARGSYYYRRGEYDQALTDYSRASQLDFKNPANYYWKGKVQYDMGNYSAAVESFTEAIDHDSSIPDFYRERSNAYTKLGKNEEALRDARQARTLFPQ